MTLQLTLIVALLSAPAAMLVAVAAISPWWPVRMAAKGFTDVFRAIPLLALLVFVYYGLGPLAGAIGLTAFSLAVIALVINEAAYLSEVYRGGLLAIPPSQWEAASSLGLGWTSSIRRVILPQALLPAVPATVVNVIQLIKDTSLASLITVKEVTLVTQGIVYATFRPVEAYLLLACLYLAIIIPLTVFGVRVEARVQRQVGYYSVPTRWTLALSGPP